MRLFLLTLALTLPASAQTTWKGLHFGSSRDQARAHLAPQGITVETSQDGALQSTADYDILLPGLRHTIPLRVDLHFDEESGGLTDVTLSLDLPAMRRNWASLGNEDALLAFAAEKFSRALNDKYGYPLEHSPGCEAEPNPKQPPLPCTINWHDTGQSIELVRLPATTRNARLFLRYQWIAPDL